MKKLAFIVLTICLIGCEPKTESEWIRLFNGKDLSGWQVQCKPEDRAQTWWSVVDSTIEANSLGHPDHDYIWLVLEKEYPDFIFEFKFQPFRESPGNSGVQVRSRYDTTAWWLDGPQIDINPPGNWRTGMMWDETRGNTRWLYPDLPADQWVDSTMRKEPFPFYYAGDPIEWNAMKIKVQGLKIQAWLNDIEITDYDGTNTLNDSIHQKYNIGATGHIALQIHAGDELRMRFKELRLKLL